MNSLMSNLQEIEYVANTILSEKQIIINLDKQRHKNREALNLMKNYNSKNLWISYGNMFIKLNKNKAKELILNDQKNLDSNINDYRDSLKSNVSELHKLEGKPELNGYDLKALDKKELHVFKDIIPEVANF